MPEPRQCNAQHVHDRICRCLEHAAIDTANLPEILQAFDQAGFEMREKGKRDPVPIGDQIPIKRSQIGHSDDWLLQADIGGGSRVVCVESMVRGQRQRSAWTAVPALTDHEKRMAELRRELEHRSAHPNGDG
ncbi:MAG: hypothetical protein NCW75_05500 [Phycisphaera sp.]|nr:MAG: hypothetical protein NCW75_05500 [Phycisphaera sp.]